MEAAAPTLERQATHTLVTSAASSALGFGISLLLARALGPAGKGMLDLCGATAALFAFVLGASVPSGLIHVLARTGGWTWAVVGGAAAWGAGAAAVTCAALGLAPALAGRLGLLPGSDEAFWLPYIVATVAVASWTALGRGMLVARHRLVATNRVEFGLKAASAVIFAGLAFLAPASGPRPFALAALGVAALQLLAFTWLLRDARAPAPAAAWPAVLATALPLHLANVLHFANQRLDVFFVQSARGNAEVGRYAIAVSLAQFVLLVSAAFAQPLLPRISAAPRGEAARACADVCRVYVVLAGTTAVLLAAVLPPLLPRLFGAGFAGSVPLLLVLLPGVVAAGLTNILVSYFVGTDRPRLNAVIAGLAAVVTVAGNASLTPRLGALGAALTSTACYGVSAVVGLAAFHPGAPGGWRAAVLPGAADWRAAWALATRFRP